jgi:hypothetical protein
MSMAEKEIITIEISIDGKKLIFDKNNYKSPLPFVDTEEDDADGQNIRIELGIAKVFHKVLDFIKTDTDLFQKQDFELLGEMLSKILFGKQGDPRGQSMLDTRKFIVGGLAKSCRIILAFDAKSNVANLPWEYVLYKFQVAEKAYETFYLSASNKSNFQIIRRFPVNIQACKHPKQEKLFVILLLNTEGNTNATPRINGMSTEVASILGMFDSLKKMFPDRIEFAKIEAASMEDVKKKVEDIVMGWKQLNNDLEPAYVLHYVGHAMLEGQIGKLAIKPKEGEPINWVKDKVFASLFNSDMLDVRQPSMVLFLACNSAKMGIIDNTLRGVAYEFTRIGDQHNSILRFLF